MGSGVSRVYHLMFCVSLDLGGVGFSPVLLRNLGGPCLSSRDHRIEFAMVRQLGNPQDLHTDTDQVNELVARSDRSLLAFSNLKGTLTWRPSYAQACASMRDLTGEE